MTYIGEPGSRSRYSDSLRAGRSGDRIPVMARFYTPVQTGPGAHPASCKWVPDLSRGVALTTHPHPAPRFKEEYSYTSTPPLGLLGLF